MQSNFLAGSHLFLRSVGRGEIETLLQRALWLFGCSLPPFKTRDAMREASARDSVRRALITAFAES